MNAFYIHPLFGVSSLVDIRDRAIASWLSLLFRGTTTLALSAAVSVVAASPVRSVGAMTFVDANTLIVADWRSGELDALELPPVSAGTSRPFNLKDVSTPIAQALHTDTAKLRFADMASVATRSRERCS